MMNKKMRRPEDRGKDWPPPEEARRNPPVGDRGALENR